MASIRTPRTARRLPCQPAVLRGPSRWTGRLLDWLAHQQQLPRWRRPWRAVCRRFRTQDFDAYLPSSGAWPQLQNFESQVGGGKLHLFMSPKPWSRTTAPERWAASCAANEQTASCDGRHASPCAEDQPERHDALWRRRFERIRASGPRTGVPGAPTRRGLCIVHRRAHGRYVHRLVVRRRDAEGGNGSYAVVRASHGDNLHRPIQWPGRIVRARTVETLFVLRRHGRIEQAQRLRACDGAQGCL